MTCNFSRKITTGQQLLKGVLQLMLTYNLEYLKQLFK